MKTILLAAALAAIGCSGKSDKPSGDNNACAAVAKGVDQMMAAGGHTEGPPPPEIAERAGKLKSLYVRHCNDDKWPADVISCFTAATSMMTIKACREKLPPEQATALRNEVLQVMSGGGGMGGMGGGSASPPK